MVDVVIDAARSLKKRSWLEKSGNLEKIVNLFIEGAEVWIKRQSGSWQSGIICGIMKSGTEVMIAWPHPKKEGFHQGKEIPIEQLLRWQDENPDMDVFQSWQPNWPLEKRNLKKICELFKLKSEVWVQRDDNSWQVGEIYEINKFGEEIVIIWPHPKSEDYCQGMVILIEDFIRLQREAPGLKTTQTLE